MDKILNPQQEEFLSYYTDPKSETFGNALQSALKAKYSQEYSENITSLMPDWLSENIGSLKMLKKAEKNLERMLDMDYEEDLQKAKLVQDTSKFIAERLGKSKYSSRVEQTGAGGRDLIPDNPKNKDIADKYESELKGTL